MEEKERWWDGVQAYKDNKDEDFGNGDVHESLQSKGSITNISKRYSSDYARWEEWIPNDPATAEEV